MYAWDVLTIGDGCLETSSQTHYCKIGPCDDKTYHNAQIYDYAGLRRGFYPWRPPLRLQVRAWASHGNDQLRGTAGFGFWNQPYIPGQWSVQLPRAVWFFFASPPNDMALARGVPGYGWKAATFDASQWRFRALLPFAPLGFFLMRIPALYHRLWPVGQQSLGVSEALLPVDLAEPHTYELIWRPKSVQFFVDDRLAHYAPIAPKGPLGFIAWLDNQYAIVTPQGQFGSGYIAVEEAQWLALESIYIEPIN